jgi:CheY-like chemotaxis protein
VTDVLVVDDDDETREAWADAFLANGFSVHSAADGFAAWQMLENAVIPVVVADLRMPRMSGGVLCERLRENSRLSDTVFIFVSGELTPPAFVRYDCYLRKPVVMEELFSIIDRLLHHSGRHFGTPPAKSEKR